MGWAPCVPTTARAGGPRGRWAQGQVDPTEGGLRGRWILGQVDTRAGGPRGRWTQGQVDPGLESLQSSQGLQHTHEPSQPCCTQRAPASLPWSRPVLVLVWVLTACAQAEPQELGAASRPGVLASHSSLPALFICSQKTKRHGSESPLLPSLIHTGGPCGE